MPTTCKTAEKFRDMAERLEREIASKRSDRRCNTPKQQKELTAARIEADHLDRVRAALERLADAHNAGAVPAGLGSVKSKTQLLDMLRTRIDHSGGYYSVRDTGEYADQSEAAVALRAWLEHDADPAKAADDARRRRIEELERDVKFRPIPGFFPTPPAVIARVLELAEVQPGMSVLEPSAGKGDLAEAARAAGGAVECVEINHTLADILEAKDFVVDRGDFLALPAPGFGMLTEAGRERFLDERFERVLMNPPFERGADAEHVQHAFKFLRPGGRLVAVMSNGSFFRSDRKSQEFREWFYAAGGERADLPEGSFENSFRSTGVNAAIVVIEKGE